jgi:uncharacterized protein
MIVDLRTITHIPRRFELDLGADWWEGGGIEGEVPILKDRLTAEVAVFKAGRKLVLEGSFSAVMLMTCDRCLETYPLEIRNTFRVYVSNPARTDSTGEMELDAEEMEDHFVSGEEIDLAETVREQVFLALPMKSLCSEDCLGLCAGCGVNLNKDRCACSQRPPEGAFSKLRHLKIS